MLAMIDATAQARAGGEARVTHSLPMGRVMSRTADGSPHTEPTRNSLARYRTRADGTLEITRIHPVGDPIKAPRRA